MIRKSRVAYVVTLDTRWEFEVSAEKEISTQGWSSFISLY